MAKWNYYNDSDPFVCEWVRSLIAAGLVPDGEVDSRTIQEVQADDVKGFRQCHFFSGILGWPEALQLAGWRGKCWTGSCPCQPFSVAGQRKGQDDERDLWPEFFRLIEACRPEVVFGEQVASSDVVGTELEAAFVDAVQRGDYAAANRAANKLVKLPSLSNTPRWLDRIFADLEAEGYTCWPSDLPAASVGAPHIRQRLYWVADSRGAERGWRSESAREHRGTLHTPDRCGNGGLAISGQQPPRRTKPRGGIEAGDIPSERRPEAIGESGRCCRSCGMADSADVRSPEHEPESWRRKMQGPHDTSERCGTCGLAIADSNEFQRIASAGEQSVHECDDGTRRLERSAGGGRNERGAESIGGSIASGCRESTCRAFAGCTRPAVRMLRHGENQYRGIDIPICDECFAWRESQRMGHASGERLQERSGNERIRRGTRFPCEGEASELRGNEGHWSDYELIPCTDGKTRRAERGSFPLAHGIPRDLGRSKPGLRGVAKRARSNRVGRLKGYGNAIVPQVAAEFIQAFMEHNQ